MSRRERLPFKPKLTIPDGVEDFTELTGTLRGYLVSTLQCPRGDHTMALSDAPLEWPISQWRIYYLGSVPAYVDQDCRVSFVDPRILRAASRIIRADQEAAGEIPRFRRPDGIRALSQPQG